MCATVRKTLRIPILRICLFGEFSLRYDDEPMLGMDTPRLQALLAYLVLLHRRTPVSRQQLAFLFRPNTAEEQALTNLRNLLHHLRRALPGHGVPFVVLDDRRSLCWRRRAPFALDVMEFEQLVDVLLDDLQWCDQETLDWLHHLLTTGAPPLLVVGTLRKDLDAAQTLDPFLLNLRRSALIIEVELAALTERNTVRLIQHVARKPVAPDVAARLHCETEGNPLFVVEIVRAELLRDQATADAVASTACARG